MIPAIFKLRLKKLRFSPVSSDRIVIVANRDRNVAMSFSVSFGREDVGKLQSPVQRLAELVADRLIYCCVLTLNHPPRLRHHEINMIADRAVSHES